MKRLILISVFVLHFALAPLSKANISLAGVEETYYAKAESEAVFMYSLPVKSDIYRVFEIPVSYYVLLYGNENQDFYKARYADVEGFVLKSSVTPVEENLNYPFANTSFRIKSFFGLPLYDSPHQGSTELAVVPSSEIITTYYGQIDGDELTPDSSTKWYYCSYLDEGISKKGYIFSYYCDQFQKILPSTESYTPITTEIFKPEEPEQILSAGLSSTAKALIAVGCSIPCLIIIILLLKKKSLSIQPKKKIIRRPKRDYYEFNEDDI